MSVAINVGASTSAGMSEYELLRQENMNKMQHELGDIFSNALQCAQNLKTTNLRFRSGRRAAHIPGLRVKLFSKLEKSSKVKKAQGKDIRRSSRSKKKQIYYDSKDENNDGKNKKRRQIFKQQKKFPLRKSKVIQVPRQKFSRKVSRLDVSLVTQEMLDNINYRSVGKIYSTEKGTTCHQCRQKTMDQKSYCRHKNCKGMRGMFCGFCLGRRYGEDVADALLNPAWICPPCRGHCNCSICRRYQGKDPTGQLAQVAKAKGYNSVCDLLRTMEGEPSKPQNYDTVQNHTELQNRDVVVFTGIQSNIDHLNDEAVLDERKTENKVEKLKSMKKDEEQCNSKNDIEVHKETSETIIDKLYKKLVSSSLLEEEK